MECKTCKYWDINEYGPPSHGFCLRAVYQGSAEDSEVKDAAMVYNDASCYGASFYTRGDHGCKQYEPK